MASRISRWGLGGFLAVFVVWTVTVGHSAQLKANGDAIVALSTELHAHQASMEQAEVARRAAVERQLQLLRGICVGVTRGNQQAAAFCLAP